MKQWLFAWYLIFISWEDLKEQQVSVWKLLIGASFLWKNADLAWTGTIPGVLVMLYSVVSVGRIGLADGIVVLLMGMLFKVTATGLILGIAVLLAVVYAGNRQWRAGIGTACTLPGIPFLTAGYLIWLLFFYE